MDAGGVGQRGGIAVGAPRNDLDGLFHVIFVIRGLQFGGRQAVGQQRAVPVEGDCLVIVQDNLDVHDAAHDHLDGFLNVLHGVGVGDLRSIPVRPVHLFPVHADGEHGVSQIVNLHGRAVVVPNRSGYRVHGVSELVYLAAAAYACVRSGVVYRHRDVARIRRSRQCGNPRQAQTHYDSQCRRQASSPFAGHARSLPIVTSVARFDKFYRFTIKPDGHILVTFQNFICEFVKV